MSEQLTNTGVSGLLAMLSPTPTVTGLAGTTASGGVLPFGAIMQAQGAGLNTAQFDANGQPLPQSGAMLPPSPEVLAQMQAQLDAKTRAPELSQLLAESSDPDFSAAFLKENQSLRDGVVMESQWPGVLPELTELSLDSSEVVALMQNAFEGRYDAQQRLSKAMGTLQSHVSTVPSENMAVLAVTLPQEVVEGAGKVGADIKVGMATQGMLQSAADGEQVLPIADQRTVPEQIPAQAVNTEVQAQDIQQEAESATEVIPSQIEQNPITTVGQPVESKRPDSSPLPESSQQETMLTTILQPDEQMIAQDELNRERVTTYVASTPQAGATPVVDSQSVAAVAAAAVRDSQPAKTVGSATRASVSDAGAGSGAVKDSSNAGVVVTQLTTPTQSQAAPTVVSAAPGQILPQGGMPSPVEGRPSSAVDVEASTRLASAVNNDALLETEESSDGWLRAETRASAQPNAAVDNVARMTPSQVAFTLAGKGVMGSTAWNQALNERVMIMTAQNSQVAEIQLDPPELGSLKVRLHVGQDQVSVSFTSPHAAVRDAVEQSMPRLREMMEEQGLSLGESSVNDQSSESGDDEDRRGFASQGNAEGSEGGGDVVSASLSGEAVSLVDYYA